MSNGNSFQKENDELLKFILTERFFKPWKERSETPNFDISKSLESEAHIEFFITSACNNKCEYCYLVKHKELYPEEANKQEIILYNLKILCDYLIENEYNIPNIDLFSGEIWHTEFGNKVFDILYEATERGLRCRCYTIPSNFSFIKNKQNMYKIQHYIDKFGDIGVRLLFSCSVDGAIIEDINRPEIGETKKAEDFYENMFLFCRHNQFRFHPMLAACSIGMWKDNFEWWKEMGRKYGFYTHEEVMLLEVRNNDWTPERLSEYEKFLEYLLKDRLGDGSEEDIIFFSNGLIGKKSYDYNGNPIAVPGLSGYMPYNFATAKTMPGCTIATHLIIRLGDLMIVPCHRTSYNKLNYGKFVVQDDKIIDIEANNVYNAIRIFMGNNNICQLRCDSCLFSPYCLKGCFGAQYEENKDMFIVSENVCKLYYAKYTTLARLYKELGIYDYLKTIKATDMSYPLAYGVIQFVEGVSNYVLQEKKRKETSRS